MSTTAVLGIDIGTTLVKALAVDERGNVLGTGSYEYPLFTEVGGIVEQNAQDWVSCLTIAARGALAGTGASVRAISLSTQGATMVPIGASGRPLCRAITWMDRRSEAEAVELDSVLGKNAVYRKTGWASSAILDAAKILWLRRNRPDIFAQTACFATTLEYVNRFLTGRLVTDPSNAGIRNLYNIAQRRYDPDILACLGITADRLPEVVESGSFIGTLTPQAAEMLSLPQDVRVYNGAHDQYCAALGCGAVDVSDMVLSCGTTWAALSITDRPVFCDESHISPGIHPVTGRYGLMASLVTAGSALKWYKDLVGAQSYVGLDIEASKRTRSAANIFITPFLNGAAFPHQHSGLKASVYGLSMYNDRYDLALAVMEGVSFELKSALSAFSALGINTGRIAMVGGGAKSRLWRELTGYITGCEIYLPEVTEACALGAALIAGVSGGFTDTYKNVVKLTHLDLNDGEMRDFYAEKYNKYLQIIDALEGVISKW